jgi:hypothetical protein
VKSGEGVEVSEIHFSLSIAFWRRNYDGCLAEGVGVTVVLAIYMVAHVACLIGMETISVLLEGRMLVRYMMACREGVEV